MTGAHDILVERLRQVRQEGYTFEHDRGQQGRLLDAAFSYLHRAVTVVEVGHQSWMDNSVPETWPWPHAAWKPTHDPARDLVKAGALIAAAIDAIEAER